MGGCEMLTAAAAAASWIVKMRHDGKKNVVNATENQLEFLHNGPFIHDYTGFRHLTPQRGLNTTSIRLIK
jgi:hypothetical protein